MEPNGHSFTSVAVAGHPAVDFCVDPAAGDPVAEWMLAHDWIDEPVMRAFLGLVEPGMRVLDLGSHIGTFSLPAAALGAEVISLDAAPAHVELLRAAAERNGFERLHVEHGALSDAEEEVAFVARSIHGHVALPGETDTITVPTVTVDALVERHGWDRVDVVKLDVEGNEPATLRGMRDLFAGGLRPHVVFECNGTLLPRNGSSTTQLRATFAALGYELLMIDHLRPGVLVESGPGAVQTEDVTDYLAVATRPAGLAERWTIEPPFSREQVVARLVETLADPAEGYRSYAAQMMVDGPGWLRAHPLAAGALRASELDVSPYVRAMHAPGRAPSPAAEQDGVAPPRSETPADLVVLARAITLRAPSAGLERSGPPEALADTEVALRDASLHLRRGHALGVLSPERESATALLRALAGLARPLAGELEVRGRPALLSDIGAVLESDLTVRDNIALFGAFLGAHVADIDRRAADLAELAGVRTLLETPLGEATAAAAIRLALVVALEHAGAGLLLIDVLPTVDDPTFATWVQARTWDLRREGGAVLQAVTDPGQLLLPVDRVLWIEDRRVAAAGHPESVLDAHRRRALGLGGAR